MFVLFLSGSWTREGGFLNNLNTWGLESNWSINKPDLLFLNKLCIVVNYYYFQYEFGGGWRELREVCLYGELLLLM